MGQSQMEENLTGHSAQTPVSQNLKDMGLNKNENDKQKPGESDSQRSLGKYLILSDRAVI